MRRSIPTLILAVFMVILATPFNAFAEYQITLQWDPNTDANLQGYRLFMRTEGSSYDYESFEWQGSTNQCEVPALVEDTTYYFVVRAYDAEDNESGDSNEVGVLNGEPIVSSNPAVGLDSGSSASASSGAAGGCFISSLFHP